MSFKRVKSGEETLSFLNEGSQTNTEQLSRELGGRIKEIYEQSQKSLLQQVCTGRRVRFTELVMFFLPEKFENMRRKKKIWMSKSLLSNVNSDARTGLQPAVGL